MGNFDMDDMDTLFRNQIEILRGRGTPEQIVEILESQKGVVLARASEMAIGDGPFDGTQGKHIPFLPVIPRSFRSLYDLIATARKGNQAGYNHLKPTEIRDVVGAPQEPYYIYDVEDGKATLGESPQDAENILKKQSRSPLTAAEVAALVTHTYVLSRHCVWATGSRDESADGVPGVSMRCGVRPVLDWGSVNSSFLRWGSASCGSR